MIHNPFSHGASKTELRHDHQMVVGTYDTIRRSLDRSGRKETTAVGTHSTSVAQGEDDEEEVNEAAPSPGE